MNLINWLRNLFSCPSMLEKERELRKACNDRKRELYGQVESCWKEIEELEQQVADLDKELETFKSLVDKCKKERKKIKQELDFYKKERKFPDIPIGEGEYVTKTYTDYAVKLVEKANLSWLFKPKGKYKGVKAIRVVKENIPGAATIDAEKNEIKVEDSVAWQMPGWELAGGLVHEAAHLIEANLGLLPSETVAYFVQQLAVYLAGHEGDYIADRIQKANHYLRKEYG